MSILIVVFIRCVIDDRINFGLQEQREGNDQKLLTET